VHHRLGRKLPSPEQKQSVLCCGGEAGGKDSRFRGGFKEVDGWVGVVRVETGACPANVVREGETLVGVGCHVFGGGQLGAGYGGVNGLEHNGGGGGVVCPTCGR
jgi:hypothetical protein